MGMSTSKTQNRYTKRWASATPAGRAGDGSLAPPFVPNGWGYSKVGRFAMHVRKPTSIHLYITTNATQVYYTMEDDPRGKPPASQSFIKGAHMAVILRGTIFNGAVVRDLEYDMTDPGEAEEKWGASPLAAAGVSVCKGMIGGVT